MKSRLLNLLALAAIALRFLFGTLWGTLATCLVFYYLTRHFSTLGTFSFSELILWIDGQSGEAKALFFSAALTIVGFLVAFQSATRNWRDQTKVNIRVQAAAEIDAVYSRICRLIGSLEVYANMHLGLLRKIGAQGDPLEIGREMQFALGQGGRFEKERQELAELHIESFSLIGRYSGIFFAVYNGLEILDAVNRSVGNVVAAAAIFVPDEKLLGSVNYIGEYVRVMDQGGLTKLSVQCGKSRQFVSGMSGKLKGAITAPVYEVTLGTFLNFIRRGGAIFRAMDALKTGKAWDSDELVGRRKPPAG